MKNAIETARTTFYARGFETIAPPPIDVTNRDYRSVAGLLALERQDLEKLRGKRVLCVAEGASNFAQRLERVFGCDVFAVDPVYARNPQSLGKQNRQNLVAESRRVAGDVRQLSSFFTPGRASLVTMPNLLSWLSPVSRQRAVRSALAMLEPGGSCRFNLWQRQCVLDASQPGKAPTPDEVKLRNAFDDDSRRFSSWLRELCPDWKVKEKPLQGAAFGGPIPRGSYIGDPMTVGLPILARTGMTRFIVWRPESGQPRHDGWE